MRLIWSGFAKCEMPSSGNGEGRLHHNSISSAINAHVRSAQNIRIYMKIHFSLILIDVDGFVTTLLLLFVISSFIRFFESVAYSAPATNEQTSEHPKCKGSREHNLAFQRI